MPRVLFMHRPTVAPPVTVTAGASTNLISTPNNVTTTFSAAAGQGYTPTETDILVRIFARSNGNPILPIVVTVCGTTVTAVPGGTAAGTGGQGCVWLGTARGLTPGVAGDVVVDCQGGTAGGIGRILVRITGLQNWSGSIGTKVAQILPSATSVLSFSVSAVLTNASSLCLGVGGDVNANSTPLAIAGWNLSSNLTAGTTAGSSSAAAFAGLPSSAAGVTRTMTVSSGVGWTDWGAAFVELLPGAGGGPTLDTRVADQTLYLRGTWPGGQAIVNVTNTNASGTGSLAAALSVATAGQTIQLPAGTFTANFSCAANGTSTQPIIIRGAANYGSVFTGRLTLAGQWNAVDGVAATGASGQIWVDGDHCRVVRCKCHDTPVIAGIPMIMVQGLMCHVDRNELWNGGSMGIRHGSLSSGMVNARSWIERNHIHDFDSGKINTTEPLQIGQSGADAGFGGNTTDDYNCVAEFNLFENCANSDDETTSAKSSGNTYYKNTLINCSRLQIRSGNRAQVIANYVSGGQGIFVAGKNNDVIGNFVTGATRGILLNAGSVDSDEWNTGPTFWPQSTKPPEGWMPRAEGTRLIGNLANRVEIGSTIFALSSTSYPTINTSIQAHKTDGGTPVNSIDGTNIIVIAGGYSDTPTISSSTAVEIPPYDILTSADVGVAYPEPA